MSNSVVAVIVLAGCGRVGFDALDDASSAVRDANETDAQIATSCIGLANTCGPTQTCSACANLTSVTDRGIRGGSFFNDLSLSARVADRTGAAPTLSFPDLGLRCGRIP